MRDTKSIELWATRPVNTLIFKKWLTPENERAELLRQTIGLGGAAFRINEDNLGRLVADARPSASIRIKGRFRVSECVQ